MFRKREVGPSTIPKTTSPLTPRQQKQEDILQFLGPAQTEFKSVLEFARFSLDNYWHNWRNYEYPRSYIIPPIFEFKHPDESDQDIQFKKEENGGLLLRKSIDRFSDAGEHQIFNMICQLTQMDSLAPFLAVQNFDFNRIRKHLNQIFANIATDFSRSSEITDIHAMIKGIHEFDYILIGPKIGIVVIEVKSSSFTASKYFSMKNRHLPDQFEKGIKQLQSFDTFLNVLSSTTGIEKPNASQIKKILFLPNLEKSRFDNWFQNLDSKKNEVKSILESPGVIFWFQNIGKIERLDETIRENTYEIYGSIIAGIASMTIWKNVINADELKLSESKSVDKASERVSSQDPLGKLESGNDAKRSNPGPIVQQFSKSIILTPDQQRVLHGPERQFIMGVAGTGKTLILQEKARQLISQGESVLILVSKSYFGKFQKFLDTCEITGSLERKKRFKVVEWGSEVDFSKIGIRSTLSDTCKDLRKLQEIDKQGYQKTFGWMLSYDHILIDDAFDPPDMQKIIVVIAFARVRDPPVKTFWMAFDYYYPNFWIQNYKAGDFISYVINSVALPKDRAYDLSWSRSTEDIHKCLEKFGDVDNTGIYYSAPILSKVMRYPENIFKTLHKDETYVCFRPSPGHKIQGFHRSSQEMYQTLGEAMKGLWKRILDEIEILQRDKVNMKDVVVVINEMAISEDEIEEYSLKRYFSEQSNIVGAYSFSDSLSELQIIDWIDVSSLEWPIVIYATCLPSKSYSDYDKNDTDFRQYVLFKSRQEMRHNARYRACTRTTGKLIEVVALFHHWR